jgi:hypothetical protein
VSKGDLRDVVGKKSYVVSDFYTLKIKAKQHTQQKIPNEKKVQRKKINSVAL